MGFDDLFKQREHRHHDNRGYYSGQQYGGHQNGRFDIHGGIEKYRSLIIEKLKGSKKLLIILAVIAIIMILIFIAVIAMLIPLILKVLGTIQTNGISGLIETAKPLLERLWSGTGK
jgi:uncharacterized membrane protein